MVGAAPGILGESVARRLEPPPYVPGSSQVREAAGWETGGRGQTVIPFSAVYKEGGSEILLWISSLGNKS